MEEAWVNIQNQTLSIGPKILTGLAIFFSFFIVAMIIIVLAKFTAKRIPSGKRFVLFIGRIIQSVLIIIGIISGLGSMGVNISALIASLGLTGFALGFALRDALSNVLSGALILVYQPFKLGDIIKVGAFEGEVREIDLRYTTLQSSGNKVLIPNSKLFTDPIILS